MPSNYEKIRKDNIRRRGEEFDDIGQWISKQLYSDRTHFIFELLQNAEDALNRRVKQISTNKSPKSVDFRLYKDRLEFRHFGDPFNEEDVKAISDILRGTKGDDRQQIGKFGIGFKSVYAFTSTPIVHSGDEHFIIERYIRPSEIEPEAGIKEGETVFILPFNHNNISSEETFDLIGKRLRTIGARTILFLRYIEEIHYWIEDWGEGTYLKETEPKGKGKIITVIGQNNEKDEEERWLVFEKQVQISDEKGGTVSVEIAFQLKTDEKNQLENIQKITSSPLVVYFPTEKETHLGFLIQGPYKTTSARDNILKEDKWNQNLIQATSELLVEALHSLKKMKLLTISLLEALPIDMDHFPESNVFHPISSVVKETLLQSELLPAVKGTYVSAKNAMLARGAGLRELLNYKQLRELLHTEKNIKWLSAEITQDRTPELRKYLIDELEIDEFTPESFARLFGKDFIEKQTDDWIIKFYTFLSGQEALWRASQYSYIPEGPLRSKPFIRLENNEHIKPFGDNNQPNVYLPSENDHNFPIVKRKIVKNRRALDFLKKLGIHEVGEKEEVESILSTYYKKDCPDPSPEQNVNHIKKFIKLYNSNQNPYIFKECFIFRDSVKDNYWTPDSFYLDTPFEHTGLSAIYVHDDEVEPDKVTLHKDYQKINGFKEFAVAMGVMNKLEIRRTSIGREHPDYYELHADYGRITHYEIDEDYKIDDLDKFFEMEKIEVFKLIWDTMCEADPKVLKARYRPNYQYSIRIKPSSVVYELMNHNWIPNSNGNFNKPADITKEELYPDFYYDDRNGWLSAIGLGENAKKLSESYEKEVEYAKALGFRDMELIVIARELENDPDLLLKVRSLIENKKCNPTFPVKISSNTERRQERLEEQINDAEEKEYETRERSVRTTRDLANPDIWLRNQYTNEEEQMVCQICKEEMPFKKRDGEYYFEAVEVFSSDYFPKEHEAQFLALCPLCAAMYKEFVKRDENALNCFREALMNSDEPEIPLQLGELNTSIRFVESHFLDIKTIINAGVR